ncbi:GntR family transcriptional regulator [Streptomyces sp. NPDC088727]|uniref:GntR family transcriptional regulator n=1 Tax=Streptomyces sp. NPDC088727 TaxID=3365875 RepID=UPI003826A29B
MTKPAKNQMKIKMPAPGNVVFTQSAADTQVGETVYVGGPGPAKRAVIVAATVIENGSAVEMTMELPEEEDEPAKYLRLAETIRQRITDGTYPVGQRVPSERQLAEGEGAARRTITRAFDLLKNEGWLEAKKASGTVARNPEAILPLCEGLYHHGYEIRATETDVWTGKRWCPACASKTYNVQTTPLTRDDVTSVLWDAVSEDGSDSYASNQGSALNRIADLLIYQQEQITELRAKVAELTKERS